MFGRSCDWLISLGTAALAVFSALAVRIVLHPLLGDNRPFLTFFGAVAVATWVGGMRTAFLTIVLSYFAANFYLMSPHGAFYFDLTSATAWGNVLTFVSLSMIIVLPIVTMQRARRSDAEQRTKIAALLEEANEANLRKEMFLATLSHELRNPLSPLSNALQIWPRVARNHAELEQLRTVMSRQVAQLTRLLDDLLDTTRIASGKIELRRAPAELGMIVASAVECVQPLFDAFAQQMIIAVPAAPVFLNADAARMTQVVTNILHNAAKFTPRGGRIFLSIEQSDDKVFVRIRDSGMGIPADLLSRVFEPFFQVDQSSRGTRGGLGLGLALAKEFVELHGGTIEANSDPAASGSEFIVTLPVIKPPAGNVEPHDSGSAYDLVRHRILIVDDVRESADTLARVLELMGQDAMPLYDPEAALAWIAEHHPDIVILDIAMPGLDGYDLARRIRADAARQSVLLVAVTGFGQPSDRIRTSEAGFDVHLTKPVNIEALKNLLASPCGRQRTKPLSRFEVPAPVECT